jgi:hypothetical protein
MTGWNHAVTAGGLAMTLSEAMGWATTALEARAKHWRDAAEGVWPDSAELYESDIDERNNMADMYEEAMATLENYKLEDAEELS